MGTVVRRVALACVLGGALGAGFAVSPQQALASCDPAYVSATVNGVPGTPICIPPVWEVGDLNCDYFYAQGIYNIILADPYNDPHGLDGWDYVDDGVGCEG